MTRLPRPGDALASGPFNTEEQARSVPAVSAAYEEAARSARRGVLDDHGARILRSALAGAGVELGEHDARIVRWLAQFGPETCAVVAAFVIRASRAASKAVAEPESVPEPDGASR